MFKPYAGVSTGILIFTKGGRTEQVWFYDVKADGYSLDDKRNPVAANGLPDVLQQWRRRENAGSGDRTAACLAVPADEIRANKYDLSINRYKEVVHEEAQFEPPKEILQRLTALEDEIQRELRELEEML